MQQAPANIRPCGGLQVLAHPFLAATEDPPRAVFKPHIDLLGAHQSVLMPYFKPSYINELGLRSQQEALLSAAQLLDVHAVALLLGMEEPGAADATTVNASGNTALHLLVIADHKEIERRSSQEWSLELGAAATERLLWLLLGTGGSLGARNNLHLSVLDLARSSACALPELPELLCSLEARLAGLTLRSPAWHAAWQAWREASWDRIFPESEASAALRRRWSTIPARQAHAQWRWPVPQSTDIHEQYRSLCVEAREAVARQAEAGRFTDRQFPPGPESLFVDPAEPCGDDFMTHPETWTRQGSWGGREGLYIGTPGAVWVCRGANWWCSGVNGLCGLAGSQRFIAEARW